MDIKAIPAANGRDIRLALFLGIANWFIFLDHIPDNVVNWITIRNYGFSGAADLFVFILGYSAAMVYAKMVLERGFIVGATRIFKRVWQLYAAYIVLFIIYIVTIGDVATQYAAPDLIYEFNVTGLIDHPIRTVAPRADAAIQGAQPGHAATVYRADGVLRAGVMDDAAQARPDDGRIRRALFCRAPVRMELAVVSGRRLVFQSVLLAAAFCARRLGRADRGQNEARAILESPAFFYFGIAYLVFAFVMTMAGHFPEFGNLFPRWLFDAFNPNDKAKSRALSRFAFHRAGDLS